MINIFYELIYAKRKKLLCTNKLKLFNKFFDIFYYLFKVPIPNSLITKGPPISMNNVIKTFKK